MDDRLMNTYARLPVKFVRGEGVWLFDDQGKRYLDTVSGIGVCSLGHAHPAVTEALCDQASMLVHASNVARLPLQERLADRLSRIAGMERAFFCNSGAEANECALKIARRHGHERDIDAPEVVVAEGSFHGRTLAMLSASGSRKVQAGFEPLVQGFVRVPYGDLAAVESVAARRANVAAVLVEPIQGEAGVRLPPAGYLEGLRRICDQHGWLLMLDEIQTGLCRTGDWYACARAGVQPDVLTTAKALGNGVPIGACLARGRAGELLTPGKHGSTFGGNPLASRAALAVLDVMERERMADRAQRLGERISARLKQRLEGNPRVLAVRGRGLMLAVELDGPAAAVKDHALQRGVLLNVTRERVIRLLPPLIIEETELDGLADLLGELLDTYRHTA